MADAALVAESTEVLARHGRSFSLAGRFLAPEQRGDAAILYAFCRLADDLVDEADDPQAARVAVDRLRTELDGDAPRPLVRETRRILAPVGLGPAHHLLDGVTSDLDFQIPEDDAALHLYCYQVAGTVGLMMCAVLGVHDESAWPHAIDLGLGMQLTNICRDVKEDAENGRVYLPRERLVACGVQPEALLAGTAPAEPVSRVVRDLLDQADAFYTSARVGYPAIPARSRIAIAMAARLYQSIGHKLRRNGSDPLVGRTVVGLPEKTWRLVRGVLDLASSSPDVTSGSAKYLAG